jgi:hypothetical protein
MDVSGILRDSLVLSHALPCQMIARLSSHTVFDRFIANGISHSRIRFSSRIFAARRRIALPGHAGKPGGAISREVEAKKYSAAELRAASGSVGSTHWRVDAAVVLTYWVSDGPSPVM